MSEVRDDDDLLRESTLGDAERAEVAEYDEPDEDEPLDDDDDDADGDADDDAPDGDVEPEDDRSRRIRELEQETADLHREIATRRNANSLRQDSARDPHLQAQMERLGAAIEEGGEPAGGLLSLIQYEQELHKLQITDMLDQLKLQSIMREKRMPAKYENLVEIHLSQMRQLGMNPTREMVLQTLIGREVLERKDVETEKQRQRGQRRIASQTMRPGGASRSTAASTDSRRGRNQDAEDEALLRSITWGEANR